MEIEVSEYDKYNNPELAGNKSKPKAEVPNKYEAYRQKQEQSGKQNVIEGRSMQEYTPTGIMSDDDNHGQVALGQDLNETRANYQSATENMFSSLAKGTGLLVSTVGSTFTTLPEGIIRASVGGFDDSQTKQQALSKIYDNTSADMWKRFNGAFETAFPVYKPESYDRESLLQNMGTSQFWGETVLKNVGFTVGAIVGGSKISKGLQALGKIAMSARVAENASMVATLVEGGLTEAEALRKVGSAIPYAATKAIQLGTGTIVASGEASMEAKQTYDDLGEKLIGQYKATHNGEEPRGEDLNRIKQYQASAGNLNMAFNMAVLTASDLFQFNKLWSRGFKEEIVKAGEIATKGGLHSPVQKSLGRRLANGLLDYGANTLSETAEEGLQTFSNAGLTDYYSRKYDKKGIMSAQDSVESLLTGMQETFGTKGGLESMLAGAITGFGSHAVTSKLEKYLGPKTLSELEQSSLVANQLNEAGNKAKPYLDSLIRQHSINQSKEKNAQSVNPSRKLHEDLNAEEFRAFVQPYIQTGNFDALEDKLNQEYVKDEARFKEDNGENATRKTGKEFVGKLMQEAKALKKNWESVQDTMPKANPAIKEMMWSILSDIDNRNDRKTSLGNEVVAAIGVPYTGQSKKEYIAQVKEAQKLQGKVNPIIVQKASDVADLAEDLNNKNAQVEELEKPEIQTKIVEEDAKRDEEVKASEPTNEELPVESQEIAPQATQTNEEVKSMPEPELIQPEASSGVIEPTVVETPKVISKEVKDIYNTLVPIYSELSKEDALDELKDLFKDAKKVGDNNQVEALTYAIKAVEDNNLVELTDDTQPANIVDLSDKKIDNKVKAQLSEEDLESQAQEKAAKSDTYSELDRMAATANRTTANHQEAIDLGLNSVLRYQNFINNPNTVLLDNAYQLQVVTPQSSLYKKLLNKKQAEYPIPADSILTVLVNTSNKNLVITDAGGNIIGEVELVEFDGDVDNLESGVITSPLVKEANAKDSGFNTVSYLNFARTNGFPNASEQDVLDKNTEVGKLWDEHVKSLAINRKLMSEGKIKYLSITGMSSGIFYNTTGEDSKGNKKYGSVSNPITEVFEEYINSPKYEFFIPKVGDITSKNNTTTKTIGNKIHTVTVGRPYLIYKDKLYPLKTSTLNSQEVDNIIKILELAVSKPKQQAYYLGKVKELVYLKPDVLSNILDGTLKGDALRDYLSSKYRQIDSKKLTNNDKDTYGISKVDGRGVSNGESQTYREFLLTGNKPALTLNFRPHPTTVARDKDGKLEMLPNFLNGYLEYSPVQELEEVNEPAKKETKTEEKTVEKIVTEEPIKSGKKVYKKPAAGNGNRTISKGLNRLAKLAKKDFKVENTEATKKWWKNAFGDESLEIVNSLINGNAFGQYTAAMTKLFSGAEVGTGYHEAFHKVTQEYLTPKQLKSLYDDVRKTVNNKFTDKQAEEYLAEDFRNFMLSGQKAIKNRPITNNIFRKIYNYLRTLLTGKTTPEQIYKKLASGKYSGAKKFNVQQFTKLDRGAIKGLTHAQTKNILESVNFHFFETLFDSGLTPDEVLGGNNDNIIKQVYGAVYERLTGDEENPGDFANVLDIQDDYSDEEFEAIMQHYELMLNINEEGVPTSLNQEVIKAHKDYLKGLGIYLGESVGVEQEDIELENEDGDNAINEENTQGKNKAEWENANETNTIYSTPNSIKLLVMSLPEVDNDGDAVPNNIGGPKLNDYKKNLNILYEQLAGLGTFEEQWDKLSTLTNRFPVFRELMKRLGEPGSTKSLEQFLLEQDFRQAFHKSFSNGTVTLINQLTGAVYQVDANANKLRDKIKEIWTSNLRVLGKDENSFIEVGNDGILQLSPDFIEGGAQLVAQNNVKGMLSAIGIEFTDLSQEDIQERYDKHIRTNEGDKYTFKENVDAIYNTLKKRLLVDEEEQQYPINDLFGKNADIKGRVDALLELEQQYSKETVELSYLNAEGKRIYAVSLNNFMSLTINHLNNAKTLEELYKKAPHLNVTSTRSSQWLKALFDEKGNKRAGVTAYMNTQAGLKQKGDNDSGKSATSLTVSDKIVQEINDALTKGTFALIRPADKSIDSAIGVSSYNGEKLVIPMKSITANGFKDSKILLVFQGYLNDELESIRAFNGLKDSEGNWIKKPVGKNIAIYNKQANNFRLFADILSSKTLEALEPYKTNTDELSADLVAKISKEVEDYLEEYAMGNEAKGIDGIKQYMLDRKVGIPYVTEDGVEAFTGIDASLTLNGKKRDSKKLEDVIKTFTVNHLIQMQEQSKLIIGDSAFYKDKIKRISAGTGTKKFAANSPNVNNWMNSYYKNQVGRIDEKEEDGIINVVIYDDVKVFQNDIEDYVEAHVANGTPIEEARKIFAAYGKWNEDKQRYEPNMEEGDAQGWITLDERRSFCMRTGGAYWSDKDEKQFRYEWALEAQDKGWDIKPWMQESLNNGNPGHYFMPQKAQYSGPQVYEGLYAPAFHKYSLAPLYYSLVKGRNMELLLNKMRRKKEGYALFGTGSKVGSLLQEDGKLPPFYNEDGTINDSDTIQQQIYYDYLGIQLDIASKVKDKLIFGSQPRKLLFSNLFGGDNPKEWAKPLMEEYNKLIDNQVNNELEKLTKKLGITVKRENKDGLFTGFTFKGDYRKLVEQLKESLEDKNTADNILDSLQVNEDGSLVYPIDALVNREKIEAMLFSIVNNKVIKQKTLGNALTHHASSGMEPKGKREVGVSNYLNFYTEGPDGRTTKMEVEVAMCETFRPLLKKWDGYKGLKGVDAVNAAIDDGKIPEHHLTMVGYRIPTQGLNSIDVMKIKKFLPESSGIAIILPTSVVAKSGGDYDIDKLNVFMPNLSYNEDNDSLTYAELVEDKPTKEGMQNRILEIASEVLTHPDNFLELIRPNTTNTLVNAADKIRWAQSGSDEPFKDWIKSNKVAQASTTRQFRFDWIMDQFDAFLGGKQALGPAAIHNTHHVLSQIAGVYFNIEEKDFPFKVNLVSKTTFEMIEEEINGKKVWTKKEVNKMLVDLSKVYTVGNQQISDLISQFINAYVDVVKDPFYKSLNAGTDSVGVWMYMIRAGMDIETISYFMTQPIILEYIKGIKLNNGIMINSSNTAKVDYFLTEDVIEKATARLKVLKEGGLVFKEESAYSEYEVTGLPLTKEQIRAEIKKKTRIVNGSVYNDVLEKFGVSYKVGEPNFKSDDINDTLIKYIKEGSKGNISKEFRESQTQFLTIFKQLEKQADGLTALMQVTNSDTKSVRSFGSQEKENTKRSKVENNPLIPKGTADRIRNSTIVGSFDKGQTVTEMFKELSMYMSIPEVKHALNDIVSNFDKKKDYEKSWTKLENDFVGYLTQVYGKTIDGKPLYSKMDLFSGDNSLAKQLIQLNKEGLLSDNPFTKELIAQVSAKEGEVDNIKMYSRRMTAFESNVISEAFRELLESNNPRLVEFGQDLAYLTILQSGLQNSPITFTELIPFEFYGNIVKGAIEDAQKKGIDMQDFTTRYNAKQAKNNFRVQDFGLSTKVEPSIGNTPKGTELQKGVFINQEGLNREEQLELFNMLKPLIESSAAKTNKGANANYTMGLGLRWDYKSNNPSLTPVNVGETLKGFNTAYGYYKEDINGKPVGNISTRLKELISKASGVDISDYDGAIINIYTPETFINRHPDQDEAKSAGKYPVVAVNIGGNGNFGIGNSNNKSDVTLKDGAAYVFGFKGNARQEFHGTSASDIKGFLPKLNINHPKLQTTLKEGNYRITLTMRRVMPLTDNMSSEPILGEIVNNVPEVSDEQKEEDKVLVQQSDSNVDTGSEISYKVGDEGYLNNDDVIVTNVLDNSKLEVKDLNFGETSTIDKADFVIRKTVIGAQQNSIIAANNVANKAEEDGEITKNCKI